MSKIEKWNRWIDAIQLEVCNLVMTKDIYLDVKGMIDANPALHHPSAFYKFFDATYSTYCVASVRRQVFPQKDSISLVGLLDDIAANSGELTLEWFCKLYEGSVVAHFAPNDFQQFSTPDNSKVDAQKVRGDLQTLSSVSKDIQGLADRRVAHLDKREPNALPTFDELHTCIETIRETASKYLLLLQASSNDLTPTIQGNWKKIFEYPWIDKKGGV